MDLQNVCILIMVLQRYAVAYMQYEHTVKCAMAHWTDAEASSPGAFTVVSYNSRQAAAPMCHTIGTCAPQTNSACVQNEHTLGKSSAVS